MRLGPGTYPLVSRAGDSPSFDLPLQTTLVPQNYRGSSTPTFTRATTAYQTDFEGKLNLLPSGAARMQGARYVQNLLTYTELFTNAAWAASNVTKAADELLATAANGTALHAYTAIAGDYVFSVELKRKTGTGNIQIAADSGTYTTVTLTSDWKRFSVQQTVAAGAKNAGIKIVTDTDAVYVRKAQLELVEGQTNKNPSEYVSVSVLSAPFHGAGVDGVKYPTLADGKTACLNGNTVASNVVTEAYGAAITSAAAEAAGGVTAGVVDASGPLGYLAEGARTNAILQSNTLGTTWTISNAADMEAVAADAYVSTDGTTTMDKLQPKATTAVHSLDQAFTFTAAKYTLSVDLRYVPATPQRWVALILNDGTTTWGASFDLLNGVVGAVSAGATSTIKATALANVYRVSVTNTANAAAAAGTVKISLNATDTATLESAARAGTETLGAGAVQLEIGTFASTYIPTTTVAVARNADVLTYASAGNISVLNPYSIYLEAKLAAVGGIQYAFGSNENYAALMSISNGVDGNYRFISNTAGTPSNVAITDAQKLAFGKYAGSMDGTNITAFFNGTAGAPVAKGTQTPEISTINIGAHNTINQLFGTIRNVRIFGKALSASKLQAMTT